VTEKKPKQKKKMTAKDKERLYFIGGILVGVFGNFMVSFFIEAFKAIGEHYQQPILGYNWAFLSMISAFAVFSFSKILLRRVFETPEPLIRAVDRLSIVFILASIILMLFDGIGWLIQFYG